MNLSASGNRAHDTNRGINMNRILISIFLLIFLINCGGSNSDSSCTECGGGLLDGYFYKEVTFSDIAGLADINVVVDVEVGKCIRFKMDGTDFSEAALVDDCCCVEYQ
jgi:hypothetical protein